MTTDEQRARDWSTIVGSWITEAERQVDEAAAADDDRAYLVAARWRQEFRTTRQLLDPGAELREAAAAVSAVVRRIGVSSHEAQANLKAFAEAYAIALADTVTTPVTVSHQPRAD